MLNVKVVLVKGTDGKLDFASGEQTKTETIETVSLFEQMIYTDSLFTDQPLHREVMSLIV